MIYFDNNAIASGSGTTGDSLSTQDSEVAGREDLYPLLLEHAAVIVGKTLRPEPGMFKFRSKLLRCTFDKGDIWAFVARRDIAPQYDLTYRFSADFDWCIRVLKASTANAYAGDKPVISFLTDGMTDKNRKASLKERFRIMCRYYGTVPTVLRHISFVPRFVLNKLRRAVAKK